MHAECANVGKLGVALYLYAPALVVGKVQLQGVELETCHLVDEQLYMLYRDEVACRVEHYGAYSVAWVVVNAYVGNLSIGGVAYIANEQLVQRLQGKEDGAFCCTFYKDSILVHLKGVVLSSFEGVVCR